MKIQSLTKLFLVAGVSCLMGSSLFGQGQTWVGTAGDGLWATALNWSGNAIPYGGTNIIGQSGAAVSVTGATAINVPTLYVGGIGTTPVLNINTTGTSYLNQLTIGDAGNNFSGIVNWTQGTLGRTGNLNTEIDICHASGYTGESATLNFGSTSSATAPVYLGGFGSTQVYVGTQAGTTGTLNLTGYGTFDTYDHVGGASTFPTGNISLGSWTNGNGTLNVVGGNLIIKTGTLSIGTDPNNGTQSGAHGVFNATIDSTGFSTILCGGTTTAGKYAVQLGGSGHSYFNLTLGSGFSTTVGQVFTLIDSATTIHNTFDSLAQGATISNSGYSFTVSYTGASSFSGGDAFTLTTSAVPEPQTWVMLFSGFGMLMGFRRMRRNG